MAAACFRQDNSAASLGRVRGTRGESPGFYKEQMMRNFILVCGVVFALIFLTHVARIAVEGSGLLNEPIFVISSIASLLIAIWSAVLFRKAGES
jgi:hypothetical protein